MWNSWIRASHQRRLTTSKGVWKRVPRGFRPGPMGCQRVGSKARDMGKGILVKESQGRRWLAIQARSESLVRAFAASRRAAASARR